MWSCCAGTSVTRLKPGCVAEPVAGAMAGALLPNNAKNDGDWVAKRSSFICVCVANMTGKWFFSSMTLQPFGPPVYFMNYTAKENLGLSIFIYIDFTFQSTSTVFQFWSERVRKAFLRENRGSSVVSIQLNSSLILNVSLIWTISTLRDLRNLSSWVPILKRVHSQRSLSPAAPWKFNIYGSFLKWGYPQIIQVMDNNFSIETTMVMTGDPPWLKKHHGCSKRWCPQGMVTWEWFLPHSGMATEKNPARRNGSYIGARSWE